MNKQLACPECKSTNIKRFGVKFSNRKRVQQYQCNNCGRITIKPIDLRRDDKGRFTSPKVLSSLEIDCSVADKDTM